MTTFDPWSTLSPVSLLIMWPPWPISFSSLPFQTLFKLVSFHKSHRNCQPKRICFRTCFYSAIWVSVLKVGLRCQLSIRNGHIVCTGWVNGTAICPFFLTFPPPAPTACNSENVLTLILFLCNRFDKIFDVQITICWLLFVVFYLHSSDLNFCCCFHLFFLLILLHGLFKLRTMFLLKYCL